MNNHTCPRCNKPMCERSDNRPCSVCSLINSFIVVRHLSRARIAYLVSWSYMLNDYSMDLYGELNQKQESLYAEVIREYFRGSRL